MAQSDHPIRPNTPQARVLQLIRQHGALTAHQMIASGHYCNKLSGSWVQRVQSLIDRGLVIVIDQQRQTAIGCIGANDRPEHLMLTLTSKALAELHRLDVLASFAPAKTPPAAVAERAAARTPLFEGTRNPLDRPPVLRPGALDFAACPSRIGATSVDYAQHC